MWCDLKKTCHMVQNWYFELLVSCESLNYSLSRTFTWISSDTGIKSYRCSKAIKNKEKHWNYDVNFLYFAVSPFVTCDGYSDHITYVLNISEYNAYILETSWALMYGGSWDRGCFMKNFHFDTICNIYSGTGLRDSIVPVGSSHRIR